MPWRCLAMIVFGLRLGWLPISGLSSLSWVPVPWWAKTWDVAKHLILPTLVLGLTSLAGLSRYMRSSMLEVIHQDYIRAAEAKGLRFWRIYGVHALRNALIPLVTLFGLMLPDLIGGGVIIETIFAYPGMGRLGYEAIMTRDYNLIMAITVISAGLTVAGQFSGRFTLCVCGPKDYGIDRYVIPAALCRGIHERRQWHAGMTAGHMLKFILNVSAKSLGRHRVFFIASWRCGAFRALALPARSAGAKSN